jgi:hypothetical protein
MIFMKTQEFINKLTAQGEETIAKMKDCKTPEEAYTVAKDAGVTDSFDDFVAVMTKVYESIKDLSEDDLDMVAGGGFTGEDVVTYIATASFFGSIVASASAALLVPALAASI